MLMVDRCFGCESAAKRPHKSDPAIVPQDDAAATVVRCRECGQPGGHAAHWTEAGTPVDGPYAIAVEGTETGVALDVTAFVTDLVVDLVQGAKFADLCDIADMYEAAPQHDGHERERLLVEQLVERLATRIPVYGARGVTLGDEIRSGSLRAMSANRQAGAA